jgi:hypothetical protein
MVRSYSRMIGQVSLDRNTGMSGASRSTIRLVASSWAGLR